MFQQYRTPNYATFGQRLLAYLIDWVLLAIIFLPLKFISRSLGNGSDAEGANELAAFVSLIINFSSLIAKWLYSAILESSVWQATIGKKIFGLIVTDLSGNRIGFGRATGRHFGKFLSSVICLVGFIMIAFTEKKQGLHDIIANTLVVNGESASAGVTLNQSPPVPPDFRQDGWK